MLFRVVYEDEDTAEIRKRIKNLSNRQLAFIEEAIAREKRRRKRAVFNEWLECLRELEKEK